MRAVPLLMLCAAAPALALSQGDRLPAFQATALTGATRSTSSLAGSPTVFMFVPGRDALKEAQQWSEWITAHYGERVKHVAVIGVDLPFFMDEKDALDKARGKIARRHWDDTWLSVEDVDDDLGVESERVHVYALDAEMRVMAKVSGAPDAQAKQTIRRAFER